MNVSWVVVLCGTYNKLILIDFSSLNVPIKERSDDSEVLSHENN